MGKRVILVHGRDFKPEEPELRTNWTSAIVLGLLRDAGEEAVASFNDCRLDFAYYGDVSNAYLADRGHEYDAAADQLDRVACLEQLSSLRRDEFTGSQGERRYKRIRRLHPLEEGLADALAGPLSWLGLSESIIGKIAPDMREYWNPDSEFGSKVRWRLTEPLHEALSSGDDILLVTHSLGSMIAYDSLWKLSCYAEYQGLREKENFVSLWITLGSPLADSTVKKNLKGAPASGRRRYPALVRDWLNVAAEDDYIAHDGSVRDDFRGMLELNLVESIRDLFIYNLAVRHGSANPHHGTGYLIHPLVTKAIADWLA